MSTFLGSPYEKGKSEVIVARKPAAIEEGLAVVDGEKPKIVDEGDVPFGVMAQNEIGACSIVVAGLEVGVQITEGCVPAKDAQVYVEKTTGKFTHVSEGNIAVNAKFVDATVREDGRVDNINARKNARCALISFVGGF